MPIPLYNRGTSLIPPNRFKLLALDPTDEGDPDSFSSPKTQFLNDHSKSVVSQNNSPDVGFDASVNPYRGCEHGCAYCYARPTHEYFELNAGVDFETRILVKPSAPALLKKALASPKWKPQVVALSGVTDCYQPVERRLQITRGCLGVLEQFRNPVAIVTKNHLVTRDTELLARMAGYQGAVVYISITTLDETLCRRLEPRASTPGRRLEAIRILRKAGVPVGVMAAPVIPGLTDHELPRILKAAADHGAVSAGYIVLRLPHAVKDIFEDWLKTNEPLKARKVMNRIRAIRGGKLNDPRHGTRMRGEGLFARQIESLFRTARKQAGIPSDPLPLTTRHFKPAPGTQLLLFDPEP